MQTLWKKFKDEIYQEGRERSKVSASKIDNEIADAETDLEFVLADDKLSEEETKLSGAVLTEKLALLHQKRFRDAGLNARIRHKLGAEVISEYWFKINKPRKPKEVIYRLLKSRELDARLEDAPQYETNSKRMANIARNYHNKLQKDRREVAPDIRDHTIGVILARTVRKTTEEQKTSLKTRLTRADVKLALKMSANKKAPGLNGMTYELWKTLDARFENDSRLDRPAFDIIEALQIVS
ncbi:hypothetical protein R3P38DRAFT_2788396 [Favolaschia claudopus]|uniref:Uncharacterized protein n=1 Tax=Favolaschia claudopus TaxID=2862362 RepID=A0AAW0AKR2_9AGAR